MKKYNIPQIEIIHFLSELVVTSSGEMLQRNYISEISSLETVLGSAEHQKRMQSFSAVLTFNE